jgi:tetratricopeptide (TPR) repeat protein
MKKILALIFLIIFVNSSIFAVGLVPVDKLFFLNYDAASEAMGGSIASFSNNALSFLNSPSIKFNVLASKTDFESVFAFNGIYGVSGACLVPLPSCNFTIAGTYNGFSSSSVFSAGNLLKSNSAAYFNYILSFVQSDPVYDNVGGLGATLKWYQFDTDNTYAMSFAFDFGVSYKLKFINDRLWAVTAFKNFGNKVEIENSMSFEMPQNFDFALRYDFPGSSMFAIAGDVIQFFENSRTGYAVGVEISPIYPSTFKVGWRDYNDGIFKGATAGLFLNFDALNIGYSFSAMDSDYGCKHAINFGFMFGSIPDPYKAYDYYLGVNFNKAKEYYNRKDYINARQLLEEILAIYPNHMPSKEYLQKIISDLDIQERYVELSINKFLHKANVAYRKNNLREARSYYMRVLGVDSSNEEATKGLAEIKNRLFAIEGNENRKKNSEKITILWQEGQKLYNESNFVFAKEKFKQIIDIDPENPGALKYLRLINTEVANVTSSQARAIFDQAMRYYNIADYENAAKYFRVAYTADPNLADAKEYYALSRKAMNVSSDDVGSKQSLKRTTALVNKDNSAKQKTRKKYGEINVRNQKRSDSR